MYPVFAGHRLGKGSKIGVIAVLHRVFYPELLDKRPDQHKSQNPQRPIQAAPYPDSGHCQDNQGENQQKLPGNILQKAKEE